MSEVYSSRLRPIEWLVEQTGCQLDLIRLDKQEVEAKRIHDLHGITPTIGCEIEIKQSSLMPALMSEYFGAPDDGGRYKRKYADLPAASRQQFDAICDDFDTVTLPKYQATLAAGIPQGNDAYWEFANAPTYNHTTLAAETGLLFDAGLIPIGYEHSLHVTLGGVGAKGGGMALVLAGLELLYVPPARIVAATWENRFGAHSSWARRGKDGLRNRDASVLTLDHKTGTELRTLTASSAEHTAQVLRTAQLLTSALMAYRKCDATSLKSVQAIGAFWPIYRTSIKELWLARGLPAASWGSPSKNPTSWLQWSECLKSRTDDTSHEYRVTHCINSIADEVSAELQRL